MTTRAGTWTLARPMSTVRSHCAAAVHQDRIYVFGGGGHAFAALNSAECYDPKTDRWSPIASMPTARSGIVAVNFQNRIYVMGGGFKKPDGTFQFLTVVEIYDPERDSWTKGPDLQRRHDAPAATVMGGRIYLVGGHLPDTPGGPLTDPAFNFAEVFDVVNGRWLELSPMPTPRFSLAAVPWEGKVLAMGGGAFRDNAFRNFDVIEAYNPSKGEWETSIIGALPWPAAGVAAVVATGAIHVFGGNDGTGIQPKAARYTPETGWTMLPPMREPRAAAAAVTLAGPTYLIGGRAADGKTPTDTVMAWQPA
jgi:N-acetylneuraminic acid mutarotase